jgi:hypothetical protein
VVFQQKESSYYKTQVIIEGKSRKVLDVHEAQGSVHDFKILKIPLGKR